MRQAIAHAQRGQSALGLLLILAVAGGIGYYVYKAIWSEPEAPSCEAKLVTCIKQCRKTSIDNETAQACQDACKKQEADCKRFKR